MFVEKANELTQCRTYKSNKWYNPPPEPLSISSTIGPLELCVKPYHSALVNYELKPSFLIQLNYMGLSDLISALWEIHEARLREVQW